MLFSVLRYRDEIGAGIRFLPRPFIGGNMLQEIKKVNKDYLIEVTDPKTGKNYVIKVGNLIEKKPKPKAKK